MATPRKTTSSRSRSGNPAARAAAAAEPKAPTAVGAWKGGRSEIQATLELPSGNIATIRRPGMESIIAKNLLPDSLSSIASAAIEAGKTGRKLEDVNDEIDKAVDEVTEGGENMLETFSAFDKIAVLCMIEPKVRMATVQPEDKGFAALGLGIGDEIPLNIRDDSLLYTDEMSLDDKAFIFQYAVGGSADLTPFRQES